MYKYTSHQLGIDESLKGTDLALPFRQEHHYEMALSALVQESLHPASDSFNQRGGFSFGEVCQESCWRSFWWVLQATGFSWSH